MDQYRSSSDVNTLVASAVSLRQIDLSDPDVVSTRQMIDFKTLNEITMVHLLMVLLF